MKNLLVLLCFLCCHIIVSECSFEELSNLLSIPLDLVTECAENDAKTATELTTYFKVPLHGPMATYRADVLSKVGCFLACYFQKAGVMEGAKLKMKESIETFQSSAGNNSDMKARMKTAVEVCGGSDTTAQAVQDPCEVALNFIECMYMCTEP